MWKVSRPNMDDVRAHLDAVLGIAADGEEALGTEEEKTALVSLYEAYEGARGRPSENLLGNGMRAEFLQAVHDAYKHVRERGRLSALRDALKLAAAECPYCGFGQIQDLDHHLQRAIYKPFSIFPLNLVPSCSTCNRGKARTPEPAPDRQLLNAYLEDPTHHEFFIATASLDPNTGGLLVIFSIHQSAGMSNELFERLKHHLDEFDLDNRLRAQVNIYLAAFDHALADKYASGGGGSVAAFLWRSANSNARTFGVNDWRTALLRGLAACHDFCHGGFSRALGHI